MSHGGEGGLHSQENRTEIECALWMNAPIANLQGQLGQRAAL